MCDCASLQGLEQGVGLFDYLQRPCPGAANTGAVARPDSAQQVGKPMTIGQHLAQSNRLPREVEVCGSSVHRLGLKLLARLRRSG
jgi:hypothetical protein